MAAGLLPALLAASLAGCAREEPGDALRFWAFGREGEEVRALLPELTKRTGVRVEVQQVPWTAAHEKILTAFVGRTTPDIVQVGNTWIPELDALGALEPLDGFLARSGAVSASGFFPGIWDTNVLDGRVLGIPWYVDTRVLFYRPDLFREAGVPAPPKTWDELTAALAKVKRMQKPGAYPILLPTDEWAQPAVLGAQAGSPLLREGGRYGAFREPPFRRAAAFYVSLFTGGFGPAVSNAQVSNVYQQIDTGDFASWICGPWALAEFRRRLAPARQASWGTMPLPAADAGADGPGVSLAGGSSLAVFRTSKRKAEAWKVVEYLASKEAQLLFYARSGDLPARMAAWEDPALRDDEKARAFGVQLHHLAPMPKVPEWESITTRIVDRLDTVIRGRATLDAALAGLDADTDQLLEKRRWLLDRKAAGAR